jgi:hypothetical protein
MTGFEVLGALAAASALLEQGIMVVGAISTLYSKIRDVPESIGQQCVQIKQLVDIAKLIKTNPALQTDLVSSTLGSCINEVNDLLAIFSKVVSKDNTYGPVKVWKAVVAVSKEKRILAHFAKLEEGKSSLALCIETVDRQASCLAKEIVDLTICKRFAQYNPSRIR